MRRAIVTGSLCLVTAAVVGCGRPVETETTHPIGVEGGTVKGPEGRISLDVPAGAVDEPVTITIRSLSDDVLPPSGIAGTAFELLPAGLTFKQPVQLTLRFERLASETTWLRIVQLSGQGAAMAPTTLVSVDPDRREVKARFRQLSRYALADLQRADAVVTSEKKKVTDVDLLFVIDNSGSMEHEQQNLAANFPELIAKLEQAQLDYRVGVVSTDLGAGDYGLPSCEQAGGDGGALQTDPREPGCPLPSDPWIERDGQTTNVPDDDVAAAFSCIAKLGISGCGFESQLESMYRAVDPQVNPGFLRDDAALAVVFITDEDDCSAADPSLFDPAQQGMTDPLGPLTSFRCFEFGVTCDVGGREPGAREDCEPTVGGMLHDVQRYVDRLAQLKPQGDVVVSAITGPTHPVAVGQDGENPTLKPSCTSSQGYATPPVRLGAFVDAFGSRGAMHSICSADFGPALDLLGQLVVERTQLSWCLPFDAVDTDPGTDALDGDCVVVGSQAGKLARCSGADDTKPCYQLSRTSSCGASSTAIDIRNLSAADLGDEVHASCLVL